MSKHQRPTPANNGAIRNLSAFLKSYVKSESFQRSLNRRDKFTVRYEENSKGHKVEVREYAGSNQLAHAFKTAIDAL